MLRDRVITILVHSKGTVHSIPFIVEGIMSERLQMTRVQGSELQMQGGNRTILRGGRSFP